MLDESILNVRNIQDRVFEQGQDIVYYTKIESRFSDYHLHNILKIETLFQITFMNMYISTKN